MVREGERESIFKVKMAKKCLSLGIEVDIHIHEA